MDNLHKPTSCAALPYFRVPSLALRAIHLVPRLRRVADLCSSTVSDTANRLRKTRKKKSSAVLLFLLTQSTICTQALKRKGRSSKRKGNHGCPFLFAPAARAAAPAASAAVPAVETARSPHAAACEIPAQKWRTVYTVRAHRKAGACDRFAILENALCLSSPACYNQYNGTQQGECA